MAWRNLWRNRRRTTLTLSSIAFGTMLAVLFTGMGDANFSEMIDLAAGLGGGHVSLQHPEYFDTPTLSRTIGGVHELREQALRDPDVERVVTRIVGHMMIASPSQSAGAAFIAFDPAQEDETTLSVLEALSDGEMFSSADARGIILGARLAESLGVGLGGKVVYTLTDKEGEIVQEATRVRGILRTGAPSVDAGLSLFPIGSTRKALGYAPDEAVQLGLFLGDQRRAESVARRLAGPSKGGGLHSAGSTLGSNGRAVAALAWHELQPDLAGFIAMKVASARFMEAIIAVLVAAGIFNTLFVSVMERMREFGVMTALGFSPANLFGLVMWESLWLGLVGLGLGAVFTALPYWLLFTRGIDLGAQLGAGGTEVAGVAIGTVMRVDIYPENAAVIACAALLATLASGLYPAWRAGSVEPVESIRLV